MKFYLPGFSYELDTINLTLIDLMKNNKDLFFDDITIGAIYGCPAGLAWNGGRALFGEFNQTYAQNIVNEYNALGIPARMTYTNSILTEEILSDEQCNEFTDFLYSKEINEILVNKEVLENYLRNKYPNFKYIASTTKCERDVTKINDMTAAYNLVVIDYNDNKNIDFLNSIVDKSKIELLINAYCSPNCPMRKEHYDFLCKKQLGRAVTKQDEEKFLSCPAPSRNFFQCLSLANTIKPEEISNYIEMGFDNFKIEGRTINYLNVVESYVYYLVKPQYRDIVRFFLNKAVIEAPIMIG